MALGARAAAARINRAAAAGGGPGWQVMRSRRRSAGPWSPNCWRPGGWSPRWAATSTSSRGWANATRQVRPEVHRRRGRPPARPGGLAAAADQIAAGRATEAAPGMAGPAPAEDPAMAGGGIPPVAGPGVAHSQHRKRSPRPNHRAPHSTAHPDCHPRSSPLSENSRPDMTTTRCQRRRRASSGLAEWPTPGVLQLVLDEQQLRLADQKCRHAGSTSR